LIEKYYPTSLIYLSLP